MRDKHLVKDSHGRSFSLTSQPTAASGSLRFSDKISALSFLRELVLNDTALRQLLHSLDNAPDLNSHRCEIDLVANYLVTGAISVNKITAIDYVKYPLAKTQISLADGKKAQILPVSSGVDGVGTKLVKISGVVQATEFVKSHLSDSEKLIATAKRLNITGGDVADVDSAERAVIKALSDGDATVVEESASQPPKQKNAIVEIVEKAAPGAREASLGPEKEEIVCGICKVKKFTVTCSHGRSQGPNNVLQVVATPSRTSAESYALLDVKVSLEKQFSGRDKVSAQLQLAGNKLSSCFNISDGAEVSQSPLKEYLLSGPSDKNSDVWGMNASPVVSKIRGSGCTGKSQTITVESYPSQSYKIEGNLDIFGEWVEKINKSWEKWGAKFFKLSPVQMTPKLTGPKGSFAAGWGWKENSDWRAYYDVSVSSGINPIFGVELEFALSVVKLGLAAVGIPPTLSDLAAEHLADLILSVAAGSAASLVGSPHAKFFTDDSVEASGDLKFTVEGTLKAGITARVGSDYVISGSLVLEGETKITGETVFDLSKEGLTGELAVNLQPLVAIARAEVRYLYIFKTEPKVEKWEPWQQIEIYKSEKLKIFPR